MLNTIIGVVLLFALCGIGIALILGGSLHLALRRIAGVIVFGTAAPIFCAALLVFIQHVRWMAEDTNGEHSPLLVIVLLVLAALVVIAAVVRFVNHRRALQKWLKAARTSVKKRVERQG